MIVAEKILSDVFDQLPAFQKTADSDGFKPVYKWGNEKHLIKQIALFGKEAKSIYPLIYQISNNSQQFTASHSADFNLVFIIACLNVDESLLNEQRWATSYQNVLIPLIKNIEKCFNSAGVFVWDGSYETYNFPNYGNESSTKEYTIDKWDAIRFETTIRIEEKYNGEPKCINKKIFK